MDPGDLNTYRDKFDAVWQRVMSENAAPGAPSTGAETYKSGAGPDESAQLRAFMDDEHCDAQLYELLASGTGGRTRQIFGRIAADERRHLRKLKAKYFILTGRTYTPPVSCPFVCSGPETLRQKVRGEAEGAAAYLDAANETGYADLAETYRALSADETRHSELLSRHRRKHVLTRKTSYISCRVTGMICFYTAYLREGRSRRSLLFFITQQE